MPSAYTAFAVHAARVGFVSFSSIAEQIIGKSPHLGARRSMLGPKGSSDLLRVLLPHIGLKQHLQSQFAGFSPCTHETVISNEFTTGRNYLRLSFLAFLPFRMERICFSPTTDC